MENFIQQINTNKYFYGIMMILMNIGARYIEIDMTKTHKALLSSKFIRRLLIFVICFIATRDVVASLILTGLFIIIVLNLCHVKSPFCVLPESFTTLDKNGDGIISPNEIKQAYETLKKAGKIK